MSRTTVVMYCVAAAAIVGAVALAVEGLDRISKRTYGGGEVLRADCKKKGGVLVTNTRPLHGEPTFVCVKPL